MLNSWQQITERGLQLSCILCYNRLVLYALKIVWCCHCTPDYLSTMLKARCLMGLLFVSKSMGINSKRLKGKFPDSDLNFLGNFSKKGVKFSFNFPAFLLFNLFYLLIGIPFEC
ncbi:hypothetical protein L6452_19713 [Arctium lappa]|uniref:Uncharacterized protein n=1 Tax=Arctium lappa TaxID=4217 RepID=A0ACB9B8I8_ARCLA|nr:hypothetical protein L6452_19713 [Arctium lappa]